MDRAKLQLRYKTGDFPDPYPLPSPEELWAKMDLYGSLAVQGPFHDFAGRVWEMVKSTNCYTARNGTTTSSIFADLDDLRHDLLIRKGGRIQIQGGRDLFSPYLPFGSLW